MTSADEKERTEVLLWIASKDFETVCDFAHVEAEQMADQLRNLAAMPLNIARKYGHLLRVEVMRGVHHG